MIDSWIKRKVGLGEAQPLTRADIEAYQLKALNETLASLPASYGDMPRQLDALEDITNLPFTTEDDLKERAGFMLCVPASAVTRIVTLHTSGTTGKPKRIYFTEGDIELMTDYTANGLAIMAGAGDTFLILMPCTSENSIGDIVGRGVERNGVKVIGYGTIPADGSKDDETISLIADESVTSMLATASTALRLARKMDYRSHIKTILLSAEYVAEEARAEIEARLGCKVYEHYGMTEMGLGGAMACEAREGYHPREADLLFEIINPITGAPVPEGEWGEAVFTTLTRKAMPLIRYRTGDITRIIKTPCPCGSTLKRLDRVKDRLNPKGY
jgi:phenylacetate-coenzyme A ligase PaaK-like adenylate-forming protein